MSQDHLGNLQWSSQDLSSFLHETILSIHVGWVPMIHLHEKMKVVQQSDFFSMSLFENRQAGIFFHTRIRQDHTSQDHFCSVINEFPVWNSKSFKPRWWDKVSHPEREAVQKIQFFWTLMIAHCKFLFAMMDEKQSEWPFCFNKKICNISMSSEKNSFNARIY